MNTWIKPDERLPENADRVLVIRKGFNDKYYWVVIAQYLYRLRAWFDDDGQRIEVFGWKSLPDLPKEMQV